ncbi:hypothetical protein CFS9_19530 [Flavobacterium sp. CFS9]|uniref:SusE outer membrane protein domain-containing protein n=1 Tax=Flavobacterium sp. CFS9 TaxID=3143118 RepID=A0AAT9H1F8_9FLAO
MKNIYRILLAFVGVLTVSCNADDVQDRPVIEAATAPVLLTPKSDFSIVLQNTNAANAATTFVWDDAQYNGTHTVVTYSLEMAAAGTNFKTPTVVATTTDKFKSFTVADLNSACLNAGFAPFKAAQIDVRVKSSLGTTGSVSQVSNFYTITATPYPAWPNWGIIGSATPNGWNDPDTNLDYDLSTKKYSYVGPLTVGEIKFRLDDSWGTNFGDDGNDLTLDAGGANIPITVAGNYTIVIDFTAKTYTIKKN